MSLAALFLLLGGLSKASNNPVAGLGILLTFLPSSSGPVALILGIVTLVHANMAHIVDGRRHAILGRYSILIFECCFFVPQDEKTTLKKDKVPLHLHLMTA